MTDWMTSLFANLSKGIPVVRMVVASVRGSAPRETGATLLFWRETTGNVASLGTIGGGHLEFNAMQIASYMLDQHTRSRQWQRFVLGASLGQCCGGVVELYWERFDCLAQAQDLVHLDLTQSWLRYCALDHENREVVDDNVYRTWIYHEHATELPRLGSTVQAAIVHQGGQRYFVERLQDNRQTVWIYGAGHVGSALVRILQSLPFRITWVDSRPEVLAQAMQDMPGHVMSISDEPHMLAATASRNAWHIVMTHSHDEDMLICEALLRANNHGFLGLIGSQSKSARFRQRLLNKGLMPERVNDIQCPVGMAGVHSKLPAAIAVSIAFQLLQQLDKNTTSNISSKLNMSAESS